MDRAAAKFDSGAEEEDLDDPADGVSTALWHLMNACEAIEGAAWAKSKAAAGCLATVGAQRKREGGQGDWQADRDAEVQAQAGLLRCVSNPFHPAIDAGRFAPQAVSLARAAYDERLLPGGLLDPDRLSVLSDALEECGCPDAVLAHLRSPGPHVRGCWAVDLCLGLT
jgi:hypothetical protein